MAKIPDIERGLLNWARYKAQMEDGGAGRYARTDLTQERVDGGEGWDAQLPIPVNDAEAELYDRAVQSLRPELSKAVTEYYLKGYSIKRKASACGVSVATVYLRIDQAHIAISGWLRDRRIAQEEQKRRTEALQQSVGRFLR